MLFTVVVVGLLPLGRGEPPATVVHFSHRRGLRRLACLSPRAKKRRQMWARRRRSPPVHLCALCQQRCIVVQLQSAGASFWRHAFDSCSPRCDRPGGGTLLCARLPASAAHEQPAGEPGVCPPREYRLPSGRTNSKRFHTPPAADLSLAPCVCQAERVATVAKKGTGILGLLVACREGSRSSGGGAGSLWAGAAMAVIVTDTLVRAYQPRWLAAGSGEDPPVERWLYRYVYSPLPALDTMRPGSSQKPDIQAEATTPGGESGGNRAGTGALASWLEEEAARRGESLRHGDLSSPAPPGQPATVGLQPTTVGLLGLAKSLTARLRSNHMVHTSPSIPLNSRRFSSISPSFLAMFGPFGASFVSSCLSPSAPPGLSQRLSTAY